MSDRFATLDDELTMREEQIDRTGSERLLDLATDESNALDLRPAGRDEPRPRVGVRSSSAKVGLARRQV